MRIFFFSLAKVLAILLATTGIGAAQVYPSRSITIIVPAALGGPTDVIARAVAEGMRPYLGQSLIVENTLGQSGSTGVGRAARAAPDGYTLSLGTVVTHVFNRAYRLEYDLLNEFEPISLLTFEPFLIVGRRDTPADNFRELVALLKRNPDKLSAGTSAIGSPSHAAAIFLQQATGTRFRLIPYRGTAPAVAALIGGEIDLLIESAVTLKPYVEKSKPLAVMAKSRLTQLANLPTVDEAGAVGLYASVWRALWAPKNTPNDIVKQLNNAVVKSLSDPAVRRRLADLGQELPPSNQQTPQALAAFQKAEIDKWLPILKAANVRPE